MGDVAVLAAGVPQRAHHDDLSILDLEGRRGKGERLESLELLQFCDVYELGGIDDRDAEVACEVARVEAVVRGQPEFLAYPCGLPFGFSLEPAP